MAGEQRAGVYEDDPIVIHVDHPGLRGDRLRDLMGIARRGDTGADVKELAYPGLPPPCHTGVKHTEPVNIRAISSSRARSGSTRRDDVDRRRERGPGRA